MGQFLPGAPGLFYSGGDTIATFGISAFITYNNNYSGNLWSDMSYTGMTFFFVLSIIIYLLGWVLLLVYAKPKELNGKENEK